MADAELLAAIGEGRTDALRELHERHAPWLAARLSHRSADRDIVDEAIQDTFVAVWRKPQAYRGEASHPSQSVVVLKVGITVVQSNLWMRNLGLVD